MRNNFANHFRNEKKHLDAKLSPTISSQSFGGNKKYKISPLKLFRSHVVQNDLGLILLSFKPILLLACLPSSWFKFILWLQGLLMCCRVQCVQQVAKAHSLWGMGVFKTLSDHLTAPFGASLSMRDDRPLWNSYQNLVIRVMCCTSFSFTIIRVCGARRAQR